MSEPVRGVERAKRWNSTTTLLPFVDELADRAWRLHLHTMLNELGAPWARQVDCSVSETAYAEAIADMWPGRGDLIIVEHDIWPTREQLAALLDSAAAVTAFPYRMSRGDIPDHWTDGGLSIVGDPGCQWTSFSGLGLIRFTQAVRIASPLPGGFRRRDWRNLDGAICLSISRAGYRIRVLWPEVEHRAP